MTRVEGKRVVIDRPVEAVWSFMTDFSNMPKWEDSHAEWKSTSDGPIEVGSTFESSSRFLFYELKTELQIVEFEPHRKFAAEATQGRAKGTRISYYLEPVEGGKTRLSRVTDAQLHGLVALLQPLLAPITRWTGGMEANNVKRILEGQRSD